MPMIFADSQYASKYILLVVHHSWIIFEYSQCSLVFAEIGNLQKGSIFEKKSPVKSVDDE